jgi:hypothetical protein
VLDYENHFHKCELKMLYGKAFTKMCPYQCKTDHEDVCDMCDHLRYVAVSDDGKTIIRVE